MSTWGGIGEGLTAGMNTRIALEEQRRREALAQKNADRQFAFQQEQAQRAQANAERQMGNQEIAAERAQSNADRDYSLRQRSADQDAQLKSMDMELRGMLGQLEAQMKQDELEGKREDRALSREKMQLDREKTAQELQMSRERLAGEKEERKLRKRLGLANIENARADIENKKANTEIAKSREAREARFGEIDRAFRQEQANIERAYKDKRLSLDERNAALREAESNHRIAMDDERMRFSREEAARNQGNVDADRALRREQIAGQREDAADDRALRREQIAGQREDAADDRALRREQLQATKEDAATGRALQERGLDIQENKNDRDDNYRDRALNESVLQADREYSLKKEAQNWQSKKAEEEWRTLQVAREELQSANRERQMQREAQQKSMSRQLSLAFQMLEDGGGNQTQLMMDDGSSVDARVLDAQDVAKIFGTDAAKRFAAVYAIDTPDEGTVFRVMNNDGSFMMVGDKPYFNEDARYKIYDRGFGKDAADRIMREAGQKRDLGMFAEKENIKAMADAKKLAAGGERGYLSALQTLIKEGNLSHEEETEVKNFMLDIMRNRGKMRGASVGGEGGEWAGFSAEKRNALEKMGYIWDASTGRPVKNGKRPTAPFATRAGAWNK